MILGGPYGSTDTAGVRAGATKRWLEISGPTYEEVDVVFRRMVDFVEVLLVKEGRVVMLTYRQMSNASWYMCAQALRGDVLNLKLRTDPVALAAVA